jgi:hypothetical protein
MKTEEEVIKMSSRDRMELLTRFATLATLPDCRGPMNPIGFQKSDSPGK